MTLSGMGSWTCKHCGNYSTYKTVKINNREKHVCDYKGFVRIRSRRMCVKCKRFNGV